jgi:acetoin utilization protein AcuB
MDIENWMKHPVHCVKPLDSIKHAREIMEEHRINQLPVVVNARLVGVVTDRDLRDAFPSVFEARRRSERTPDPSVITVETVMTSSVLTLGPKDTVVAAARLMRQERIGAIPIVDAGRLVGILARSDVLDAFVALAEAAVSRGADLVIPQAHRPARTPRPRGQ